jgi:hypothetical protein
MQEACQVDVVWVRGGVAENFGLARQLWSSPGLVQGWGGHLSLQPKSLQRWTELRANRPSRLEVGKRSHR